MKKRVWYSLIQNLGNFDTTQINEQNSLLSKVDVSDILTAVNSRGKSLIFYLLWNYKKSTGSYSQNGSCVP